jgi:hypothetical protein
LRNALAVAAALIAVTFWFIKIMANKERIGKYERSFLKSASNLIVMGGAMVLASYNLELSRTP